jgi:hypothetical protein
MRFRRFTPVVCNFSCNSEFMIERVGSDSAKLPPFVW